MIADITRTPLPDGVRVSIELDARDRATARSGSRIRAACSSISRARAPVAALQDATLKFDDDVVQEIRLGRHPQNTTRVVMDMEAVETLQRLHALQPVPPGRRLPARGAPRGRGDRAAAVPAGRADPRGSRRSPDAPADVPVWSPPPAAADEAVAPPPVEKPVRCRRAPAVPPALPPPAVPTANSNGQFSLARQLGLGVSRIVIDAGHGGHDPGRARQRHQRSGAGARRRAAAARSCSRSSRASKS